MTFRRLLIDIGNSRVKWSVAIDRQLGETCSRAHEGDAATVLQHTDIPLVDEVWISDVLGPSQRAALGQCLLERCNTVPTFAAVQAKYAGLRCAYEDPARLGVDRWLMLLAAWAEIHCSACVASAGTALTFDAVDDSGQHLGGCIAPGLWTMQRAVLDTTRFKAGGPQADYTPGLGRDTETCVRQGSLHAAAGFLDRLAQHYGAHAKCLLTGGDAAPLVAHSEYEWHHRPTLVLEGLLVLATHDQDLKQVVRS